MRNLSVLLAFFCLVIIQNTANAGSDPRRRFEGLIGRTVQDAWDKINREAPGRTVEIMRESSPQVIKTIRRGVVRVIISDQTGRVLHTPILQFDAMKRGDRIQ